MRYIDADILEASGWVMSRIRSDSETTMVYEIKKPTDFPTADVRPVVRGEWMPKWNSFFKQDVPACSNCGMSSVFKYNYCPNCGAEMRGQAKGKETDGLNYGED